MKEKITRILQSLRNKAVSIWDSVRSAVCRAWSVTRGAAGRAWASLSSAGFVRAVRGRIRQVWDSKAVRSFRAKAGQIRDKLATLVSPQKAQAQSAGETAATDGTEGLTTELIENELRREKYMHRYRRLLRSTVYALIVTAAAAALVATLLLPVLQIYGSSMTPTLREGDIVVSVKTNTYDYGDICSFYYSNRILVKRVIGKPMDLVEIDEYGNVYVNGKLLDEPYVKEKALGECDIEFPFRVPEGSYFMIGDHRATSIDSRSSSVGCISHDEIVGRIIFTVWPIKRFGVTK